MFSSYLFRPGMRRALIPVLFCLLTALLFVGCKTEADDDFGYELDLNLVGNWLCYWGDGQNDYDGYIITTTHLFYSYGDTIGYSGAIRDVTTFSNSAGVIIIEYDADYKPSYYDENYEPVIPPKGDFVGIYYRDLTPNVSVGISQAIDLGDYTGAEETTLDAAIAAFTAGNSGNYVSYWGGPYLKQ